MTEDPLDFRHPSHRPPGRHNQLTSHPPLHHVVDVVDWMADFLYRTILPAIEDLKTGQIEMTKAMDDLQASLTKYVADVEAYRQTVKTAVADALAADEAGEDSALVTMKATIDAADASLVPPTPPVV